MNTLPKLYPCQVSYFPKISQVWHVQIASQSLNQFIHLLRAANKLREQDFCVYTNATFLL